MDLRIGIVLCIIYALAPTSQASCLSAIQACFPRSTEYTIKDAFNKPTPDYARACSSYGDVKACIKTAQDANNDCDADSGKIKKITDAVEGSAAGCNADGTVDQCSINLVKCESFLEKAVDLTAAGTQTSGCVYANLFEDCIQDNVDNKICTDDKITHYKAQTQPSAQQILENCDSDCENSVAGAFKEVARLLSGSYIPENTCPKYKEAIDAVNGLKEGVCKDDTKGTIKANKDAIDLKDYCTEGGEQSECAKANKACEDSFKAGDVEKQGKEERCNAIGTYIQCLEGLKAGKCSDKFVTVQISNEKYNLAQEEKASSCDLLGSCSDMMSYAVDLLTSKEGTCDTLYSKLYKDVCRVKTSGQCKGDEETSKIFQDEFAPIQSTCKIDPCNGTSMIQSSIVVLLLVGLMQVLRMAY